MVKSTSVVVFLIGMSIGLAVQAQEDAMQGRSAIPGKVLATHKAGQMVAGVPLRAAVTIAAPFALR
jgi:hypothetical protein